jgi:hypothetical protein
MWDCLRITGLNPPGRLLMPMTSNNQWGGMLLVTRQCDDAYAARFLCPAGFIEFSGPKSVGDWKPPSHAIVVSRSNLCDAGSRNRMIHAGSPGTVGGSPRQRSTVAGPHEPDGPAPRHDVARVRRVVTTGQIASLSTAHVCQEITGQSHQRPHRTDYRERPAGRVRLTARTPRHRAAAGDRARGGPCRGAGDSGACRKSRQQLAAFASAISHRVGREAHSACGLTHAIERPRAEFIRAQISGAGRQNLAMADERSVLERVHSAVLRS